MRTLLYKLGTSVLVAIIFTSVIAAGITMWVGGDGFRICTFLVVATLSTIHLIRRDQRNSKSIHHYDGTTADDRLLVKSSAVDVQLQAFPSGEAMGDHIVMWSRNRPFNFTQYDPTAPDPA